MSPTRCRAAWGSEKQAGVEVGLAGRGGFGKRAEGREGGERVAQGGANPVCWTERQQAPQHLTSGSYRCDKKELRLFPTGTREPWQASEQGLPCQRGKSLKGGDWGQEKRRRGPARGWGSQKASRDSVRKVHT